LPDTKSPVGLTHWAFFVLGVRNKAVAKRATGFSKN